MARGTRLPEDWRPDETGIEYARARCLDIDEETESFRDYWFSAAGQRATKLDWNAAWRGWCRKCVEFGKGKKPEKKQEINGEILALAGNDVSDADGEGWLRICHMLREELGVATFNSWISNLTLLQTNPVVLAAPSRFYRDWVTNHYLDRIKAHWNDRVEIVYGEGK